MSIRTSIQTGGLGAIIAAALAGPLYPIPVRTTDPSPPVRKGATTTAAGFVWPGIYDMIATGFPDGERNAVMHVEQRGASYALVSLQGPPGSLVRFRVAGDSAHVIWNTGTGVMAVDLRGSGDSLTGEWESGDWAGTVRGSRRR